MRKAYRLQLGLLALLLLPGSLRSQDTVRVRADNAPLWGERPALIPELRLGSIEGSAEEAFGRIVGVVVGREGEIVIADSQGPSLRVFDATGAFVRNLGRPGEGPGEYRRILAIQSLPSGAVAVWDPGNQRVSTFDIDGFFRGSVRAASGLYTADPFRVDSAGNFYVKAIRAGARGGIGVESAKVWLRIAPNGVLLDSIPIPMARQAGVSAILMTPAGERGPFVREIVSTRSPLGYEVRGHTGRLAFDRTLRDGRVLRVERSFRAVPVNPEERAQWQAFLEAAAQFGGSSAGIMMPVPSRKPAFRQIWVDADGRVWLSRYVEAVYQRRRPEEREGGQGPPPIDWIERPTWDVFDPRGTFLGTVLAPERGIPMVAIGDRVWFLEQGEFGENYVTRYRIEGATAPVGGSAFP